MDSVLAADSRRTHHKRVDWARKARAYRNGKECVMFYINIRADEPDGNPIKIKIDKTVFYIRPNGNEILAINKGQTFKFGEKKRGRKCKPST